MAGLDPATQIFKSGQAVGLGPRVTPGDEGRIEIWGAPFSRPDLSRELLSPAGSKLFSRPRHALQAVVYCIRNVGSA